MKLSKKWKIILPTAGVVTAVAIAAPTAILLTQESSRQTPQNNNHQEQLKTVKVEVPDSIIPGSHKSLNNEYENLKAKQMNFKETPKNSNFSKLYTLENDFCIFVFYAEVFTSEYLGSGQDGYENAKKLFIESMKTTNMTLRAKNEDNKIVVTVEKEFVGAGSYARDGNAGSITLNIQKNFFDYRWVAFAFAHEWGHLETFQALRKSLGFANDAVINFYNDFTKHNTDFPLIYKNLHGNDSFAEQVFDLNNKTNNTNLILYGYDWGVDKAIYEDLMYDFGFRASNGWIAEKATVSEKNATLTSEYLTRMTFMYNTNFQRMYDNKVRGSLTNITDLTAFSQYNFFNPELPLQSFGWMQSLLKNVYCLDGKMHINYNDIFLGSDQAVSAYAGGNDLFSKISRVQAIWNDGSKEEIAIIHDQFPFGFYKNPFAQEQEYKYVIDESYSKKIHLQNKSIANVKEFKFFDNQGNQINNVPYDVSKNDFW